ncbi:hypothetical protein BBP40_011113, partial [Aspergillus hancockii]
MSLRKPIRWLYHEFGIASVHTTGRDVWLIILARTGRMFAYGGTSLIIALFFASLQFSDFQIGIFMTFTLAGDVLLSLLLTLAADRIGRRRVLFAGAFLMVLSGAVFSIFENFWILLLAAILGVISATGSDFGPFRSIEESTLSHLTTPETRADVLSWYVTTSSLGSAAGTEFTGRAVDYLQTHGDWPVKDAYHAVFWLYILTGAMCMICTFSMSDRCELAQPPPPETGEHQRLLAEPSDDDTSTTNTSAQQQQHDKKNKNKKTNLFSHITSQTRKVMYQLWFLLALDSLADGMVPTSLTNYYLDHKFHLPKSTLGDIMSTGFLLSSVSTVFAGPLARHLGLINTMVFTHLPSSTAVLLFPIPKGVALSVVLYFVRTGLN